MSGIRRFDGGVKARLARLLDGDARTHAAL